MLTIRIAIALIGSVALVALSWRPLRSQQAHGFFRFFAWEAILLLFALNLIYWIVQPFAWWQIIAWTLLIFSLALLIPALRLLKRAGQQDSTREGESLYEFEKTSKLVTVGLYGYIRHPLYSSLLFLAWGIFFKHPDWIAGALALVATAFLWLTARREEAENLDYFGPEYAAYMRRTRMFIPFLF